MNITSFPRKVLNRLQPITRRHRDRNPISDLFPWVISDDFDTCFQSHDIASLFNPSSNNFSSSCLFVVFNPDGLEIFRRSLTVQSLIKTPISLSLLLRSIPCDFGTFSLFHERNPDCFVHSSSVLTERGYVYFTHRSSSFRHYVHGNYDAATLNDHGHVDVLGGISFVPRTYNFQFSFNSGFYYDLFFTNPTPSRQSIYIYESSPNDIYDLHFLDRLCLNSRGSFVFKYRPSHDSSFLAFRSNLVLCRPICFKRLGSTFDVFHA